MQIVSQGSPGTFFLAKQVPKSEQTSFFSQTYVCLANNKLLPKKEFKQIRD